MPDLSATPSLLRRLMVLLLVPLTVLVVIGAIWDYALARRLTDDAYDQVLASAAFGLAARLEAERDQDLQVHLDAMMRAMARIDAPDVWRYLVLDGAGKVLAGDAALSTAAAVASPAGPTFATLALPGGPMRAVTLAYSGPDGRATIVVAESLARRVSSAGQILVATVWPNVLTMLVALAAVGFGVRYALRPLSDLSRQFERKDVLERGSISRAGAPREILPLVDAVEQLMQRLRDAALSHKAFLSKSAHQLRTPLAGLQTQVELLCASVSGESLQRAERLHDSVRRLGHLTHQMLALARSESNAAVAQEMTLVSLPDLLEEVAGACLDQALARQVDVGFDAQPARVRGVPWMLREMLLNLVDNAIAHSPPGAPVNVRCGIESGAPGWATLEVEDRGPGIATADRERIFEAFVRLSDAQGPGSGLGLAIVREVVQRHGAHLQVLEGAEGVGTLMRVRLPPDDAPSA
jgi:two-component system sensor histidine kinase TctE